jgi:hypothetical protein
MEGTRPVSWQDGMTRGSSCWKLVRKKQSGYNNGNWLIQWWILCQPKILCVCHFHQKSTMLNQYHRGCFIIKHPVNTHSEYIGICSQTKVMCEPPRFGNLLGNQPLALVNYVSSIGWLAWFLRESKSENIFKFLREWCCPDFRKKA